VQRIYMDANATTPLLPAVMDAVRPYYLESFGNPSSIHQQGQQARAAVEQAREHVAALLHSAEALEKLGVQVTWLGCDERGIVSTEELKAALESTDATGIKPRRRIVSIMMANNETGVIQPIAQLAFLAHQHDALFHTDAVQAAGKIPIDVKALGVDLLSIAGHKMHAPLGTGALFVRRGLQLKPMFHGGAHERRRRPGTENLPGIVGLGKAAELAAAWLSSTAPTEMAALRDHLEQEILAQISDTGVNGAGTTGNVATRVPNTSNIWFDHVEGEALVIALDLKGISVSGGSACASGAVEPSHVLMAMGANADRARASLRFSLSKLNTAAEVDALLNILPAAVARLRELSPKVQQQTLRRQADTVIA
jgi:cysteine desulfurase